MPIWNFLLEFGIRIGSDRRVNWFISPVLLFVFLMSCGFAERERRRESPNFQVNRLKAESETLSYDRFRLPRKKRIHIQACINPRLIKGERIVSHRFKIISNQLEKSVETKKEDNCLEWHEDFEFSFSQTSGYIRKTIKIVGEGSYRGSHEIEYAINPWLEELPNSGNKFFFDLRIHQLDEKSFVSPETLLTASDTKIQLIDDPELKTRLFKKDKVDYLYFELSSKVRLLHKNISGENFYLPIPKAQQEVEILFKPVASEAFTVLAQINDSVMVVKHQLMFSGQSPFASYSISVNLQSFAFSGDLSNSVFSLTPVESVDHANLKEMNQQQSLSSKQNFLTGSVLNKINISPSERENWIVDDSLTLTMEKFFRLSLDVQFKNNNTQDRSRDSYGKLPDGKYRLGLTFLKKFHKSLTDSETIDLHDDSLFLDTKEYQIDVSNGKIVTFVNFFMPDFRFYNIRGLLVIDLLPLQEHTPENRMRFVAEVILNKGKAHSVVYSASSWENVRFLDDAYQQTLNLSYEDLRQKSMSIEKQRKQTRNLQIQPENYAAIKNLKYINTTDDDASVLRPIFNTFYKGSKIYDSQRSSLCDFWSKELFYDDLSSDEENEKLAEELLLFCRDKLKDGLSAEMFLFQPVWLDFRIVKSDYQSFFGYSDLSVLSQSFSARHIFDKSLEAYGGLGIDIGPKNYKMIRAGVQLSGSLSGQNSIENTSVKEYFISTEYQDVRLSTSQIRPCLIITPNLLTIAAQTKKLKAHAKNRLEEYLSWVRPKNVSVSIEPTGVFFCDKTILFRDQQFSFDTTFYFLSQKFKGDMVLDGNKLKNQPWLEGFRGKVQFKRFMDYVNEPVKTNPGIPSALDLLRDNNSPLDEENFLNPTELLLRANGKFNIYNYPSVHLPTEEQMLQLKARFLTY